MVAAGTIRPLVAWVGLAGRAMPVEMTARFKATAMLMTRAKRFMRTFLLMWRSPSSGELPLRLSRPSDSSAPDARRPARTTCRGGRFPGARAAHVTGIAGAAGVAPGGPCAAAVFVALVAADHSCLDGGLPTDADALHPGDRPIGADGATGVAPVGLTVAVGDAGAVVADRGHWGRGPRHGVQPQQRADRVVSGGSAGVAPGGPTIRTVLLRTAVPLVTAEPVSADQDTVLGSGHRRRRGCRSAHDPHNGLHGNLPPDVAFALLWRNAVRAWSSVRRRVRVR